MPRDRIAAAKFLSPSLRDDDAGFGKAMMTTTTDAAHDVPREATGKLTLLRLFALVFGSIFGGGSSICHRTWPEGHAAGIVRHRLMWTGKISPI